MVLYVDRIFLPQKVGFHQGNLVTSWYQIEILRLWSRWEDVEIRGLCEMFFVVHETTGT